MEKLELVRADRKVTEEIIKTMKSAALNSLSGSRNFPIRMTAEVLI